MDNSTNFLYATHRLKTVVTHILTGYCLYKTFKFFVSKSLIVPGPENIQLVTVVVTCIILYMYLLK